jgi:hypothetical protein
LRTEEEIKKQVTGVRERVKELSGFYIGEGAAMLYVLEWVLGKRETAPSGELGRAGGESGQIAVNLTKLAQNAAEQAAKKKPAAEPQAAKKKPAAETSAKKRPASGPRRVK